MLSSLILLGVMSAVLIQNPPNVYQMLGGIGLLVLIGFAIIFWIIFSIESAIDIIKGR